MPPAFDQFAHAVDRAMNDCGDIYRLLGNVQSSPCDTRDVQQVIDQASEVFGLAANHHTQARRIGLVGTSTLQYLTGTGDDGERIAQLMGQHTKELVLATV